MSHTPIKAAFRVARILSAGDFYAEAIRKIKHPEYMQGFLVQASRVEQGDADQEIMAGGGRNMKP